jgi:hypothetical protein
MLPAKVRAAVRGLIKGRVARLIEQLRMDPDPMMDGLISETARGIGEAGCMLDPEAASSAVGERYDREARQYARVCMWDGECEADATTDDGLCSDHAAQQAREQAEVDAELEKDKGAG